MTNKWSKITVKYLKENIYWWILKKTLGDHVRDIWWLFRWSRKRNKKQKFRNMRGSRWLQTHVALFWMKPETAQDPSDVWFSYSQHKFFRLAPEKLLVTKIHHRLSRHQLHSSPVTHPPPIAIYHNSIFYLLSFISQFPHT